MKISKLLQFSLNFLKKTLDNYIIKIYNNTVRFILQFAHCGQIKKQQIAKYFATVASLNYGVKSLIILIGLFYFKGVKMIVKEGYFYHIKDDYFALANDKKLMKNKENGNSRPMYLCQCEKDSKILWFVPISSKYSKYKKIKNNKEIKGKKCDGIVLGKLSNVPHAFLIQNAFPATEKYIDHIHTISGVPLKIKSKLQKEIRKKFSKVKSKYFKFHKGIFPDVIKIKRLLEREIPLKERIETAKK